MLTIEGIIATTGLRKRIEIDINSGVVSNVGDPIGSADIFLNNELIFPGFIDIHVHAREDSSHEQDYKEDFVSAGEAAINGGVVAFADMPNNVVPPVDDTSYDIKNELAKSASRRTGVDIVLYAGIGPHTSLLNKKVPYKVFMGHSIGDLFFTNYEDLEKAIAKYNGQNVSFHCEDPKILEENKNELKHESRRPSTAEVSAVDFALHLIQKYNLIGKICHASTIEAINKIVDAKSRGVNVTVEVTPHHLYFDETNMGNQISELQVNPPIRQTQENRLALIKNLKDGNIDYLATDHAPHTIEEKAKGISGMPHLDTYGYFATWLMHEHNFTPQDIARVCAKNPGDFINQFIEEKYGTIEQGCVGSFTIIDTNKPTTITKEMLKTKCGHSPFTGVTFPGSVVMTIVKGKIKKFTPLEATVVNN